MEIQAVKWADFAVRGCLKFGFDVTDSVSQSGYSTYQLRIEIFQTKLTTWLQIENPNNFLYFDQHNSNEFHCAFLHFTFLCLTFFTEIRVPLSENCSVRRWVFIKMLSRSHVSGGTNTIVFLVCVATVTLVSEVQSDLSKLECCCIWFQS